MIKNNITAKSLINSSKELIDEAENELKKYDGHACENISKFSQLRDEILNNTIKRFEKSYKQFTNYSFPNTEVTYSEEMLEDIKENFYTKSPDIEPLHIPKISTAGFSSTLVGIIWTVIVALILMGIGVAITGTNIDPNTIMQNPQETQNILKPIFDFYAKTITPSDPTTQNGMLAIGAISAFLGLIFGTIRYHKRSNQNLTLSQEIFEKAKEHKIKKDIQKNKVMTLCEYTKELDKTLYTLQIYIDEYGAVLKRILHTEGNDFEMLKEASRQKLQSAAILYKEILRLIDTDIVTDNGELNPLSRYALHLSTKRLDELMDGELEPKEDIEYIEEHYIIKIDSTEEDETPNHEDESEQNIDETTILQENNTSETKEETLSAKEEEQKEEIDKTASLNEEIKQEEKTV